jgi:outer membrane protein OmpA-like peptidoglycan-associated protein
MKKLVLRLAAVVAVGVGASACSDVPDWVDATTWFNDGTKAPDLADIPQKPAASTPDDQKQVADSLAADRARANYSAEQLKAGNDPSTAPPPAPAPVDSGAATPSAAGGDSAPAAEPSQAAAEQTAPAQPPAAPVPASTEQADAASTTPAAPAPAPAAAQNDSLGFRPSAAPPLDPSVTQFMSPTLAARYHQTASASTTTTAGALSAAPAVASAAGPVSGGATPAAIVFFPGDGTALNAAARAKVHEIVATFQSNGGQGFIKVVGHSSSRTPDMPVEAHQKLVFQRSQDRADAVAKELIREGVPAAKVLVEAVGDSQPIYYESMPKGEAGNRRAEIFFQS